MRFWKEYRWFFKSGAPVKYCGLALRRKFFSTDSDWIFIGQKRGSWSFLLISNPHSPIIWVLLFNLKLTDKTLDRIDVFNFPNDVSGDERTLLSKRKYWCLSFTKYPYESTKNEVEQQPVIYDKYLSDARPSTFRWRKWKFLLIIISFPDQIIDDAIDSERRFLSK